MSDDVWRRGRREDSDDDDYGPPLFGGDATHEMDDLSSGMSFGTSDTGPLPHWTAPPTGEIPSVFNVERGTDVDPSDDLDVWSSFSNEAPVWSDDPAPTGELDVSERIAIDGRASAAVTADPADGSAPIVRRGPGRITIGTDPTDDRMGRPMPKKSSRGSGRVDPSRGGRPSRPVTSGSRTAPPASSGRDLPTAIAIGLIIAAAFIGALLFEPWAVLAIIVAVVGLAAVEFFDKVTEKGYRPATVVGIAASVCLPLAAYWVGESALPIVFVLAFAAACLTFITSGGIESSPLPNTAITMLGIVWIGLMGSFAALIVAWSNISGGVPIAGGTLSTSIGTDTMFLMALGVVANDVGALFIGSAAGRTPLRQWISPNKTVEGFIGGTVMTLLAMIVVAIADLSSTWNSMSDLLILGVVIALVAPLGDLTESMFKRNLEIKDFGSIVKGHGGMLDRFDGFLFTLPAVYYLVLVLQPWVTK